MLQPWVDRFRALSDETRLLLLAALLDEELSVGELAELARAAQPGVSRHLSALRDAGLVTARKQGTATFYRLASADPLLEGPLNAELRDLALEQKLTPRVERVLARRRAKSEAFFDQADDWDALRGNLFTESAGLASLVPLVAPGLTVADIGTGTGGMLPYLAEVAEHITAVDLSAEMLRRARAKAKHLGLRDISFLRGELSNLPLADNAVDAAFAALVLHHAPRPSAAVREMARITKPGGVVVVVDLIAHGHEWLKDEQADVWLGFSRDEMLSLFEKAALASPSFRVVSRVETSGKGGTPLELFVASARVT